MYQMWQIIAGFLVWSVTLFLLGVQWGMETQEKQDHYQQWLYTIFEKNIKQDG